MRCLKVSWALQDSDSSGKWSPSSKKSWIFNKRRKGTWSFLVNVLLSMSSFRSGWVWDKSLSLRRYPSSVTWGWGHLVGSGWRWVAELISEDNRVGSPRKPEHAHPSCAFPQSRKTRLSLLQAHPGWAVFSRYAGFSIMGPFNRWVVQCSHAHEFATSFFPGWGTHTWEHIENAIALIEFTFLSRRLLL